jgi:hypothetical protein
VTALLARRAALRPRLGWTFDRRVQAASGLAIPVPQGYRIGFWDDFTAYATYSDLLGARYGGAAVYGVYSGQDGAYASGWWAQSHVTFTGGQLVLNGYFDAAAHATKYVTGGFGTWSLAQAGNVPAGAMWVWCAREEAAGGEPVKTAVMTYGATYPAAGVFQKMGAGCVNVGNGYAEWPYCGEDDMHEGDMGTSPTATLHWHEPGDVTCSVVGGNPTGNLNGHRQQQLGTLTLDRTQWHIGGARTDPATGLHRSFTNDAAQRDVPLREWLSAAAANVAFSQAGRTFIYQQEAWSQPTSGAGTKRVFLDWIACLVPGAGTVTVPVTPQQPTGFGVAPFGTSPFGS